MTFNYGTLTKTEGKGWTKYTFCAIINGTETNIVYSVAHVHDQQDPKVINDQWLKDGLQTTVESFEMVLLELGADGWEAVSNTMFKKEII